MFYRNLVNIIMVNGESSPLWRHVCKPDRVTHVGDSVKYHCYLLLLPFLPGFSKHTSSIRPVVLTFATRAPTYCCAFFRRSPLSHKTRVCVDVRVWVCVYCVTDRKAVRTTDAKRIANNNDDKPAGQVDATGLSAARVGKLAPLQSAYRVWCDSAPGPVLLEESPLILCFHFQSIFFPHFSFRHSPWRPRFVHFMWISRDRISS